MKLSFRSIVLAGAILALAAVHTANAQINTSIDFTTSFPFAVGNATVPPGSYSIRPIDNDPQVLELKGPQTSVFFATESAQPRQTPSKSEVVFSRYGTRYVLKNVWVEGSDIGYVSADALAERQMAKSGNQSSEHRIAARKTARASK